MNKKSLTGIGIIISLAVILLLVFLLSSLLFDKGAIFNKNINSCEAKGGKCVAKCDYNAVAFECKGENLECCINLVNLE